tara:strand:- start:64 stop:567 length:504 start_codon:yes stop_codon:yes gene_type:complete
MTNFKVIDNFLNDDDLNDVKDNLFEAPLYFQKSVSGMNDSNNYWNYYFTHLIYMNNKPVSKVFHNVYNIFIPKFEKYGEVKNLIRIKLNFYPYTETLKEHGQHSDFDYPSYAAVFSLNTCDGFTRLNDGTKIDSVENRILFFDPSLKHNSTTTTNSFARWNINFNFL